MTTPARFPDPWQDWPGGSAYEALADFGVTPDSSIEQVRQAFFEMMELGLFDDEGQRAYNQLHVAPSRLLIDALHYDEQAAAELLQMLMESSNLAGDERPLHQQIQFAWEV